MTPEDTLTGIGFISPVMFAYCCPEFPAAYLSLFPFEIRALQDSDVVTRSSLVTTAGGCDIAFALTLEPLPVHCQLYLLSP